jgi:hypothetical protein
MVCEKEVVSNLHSQMFLIRKPAEQISIAEKTTPDAKFLEHLYDFLEILEYVIQPI